MFNLLEANKQFEIENNIIYPEVKRVENTKKISRQEKLNNIQSCLINHHTGRSTIFKILSFLPSFVIVNNNQKIIELFILNSKICNFNLSEQTIHYQQWSIKNNGINQNAIYSDKKVLDILNTSIDSFYKFVGSNPDIFPNGITKINSSIFRVDHVFGGHFIATLEQKNKSSLVLMTSNRDKQKLLNYLDGTKKELSSELLTINKEYKTVIAKLSEQYKKDDQKLTLAVSKLRSKVISLKIKKDKLENKIIELNKFNFDHFITALKYQLNLKEKVIINLLSDKKTDNYMNNQDKVTKVKIKDLKKNIKRVLLLSISGNNHLRKIKLVITNTLTFNIDEIINLCLMNTDDLGYPKILKSKLTDNDYINLNNLYLLDHGCYFESIP